MQLREIDILNGSHPPVVDAMSSATDSVVSGALRKRVVDEFAKADLAIAYQGNTMDRASNTNRAAIVSNCACAQGADGC